MTQLRTVQLELPIAQMVKDLETFTQDRTALEGTPYIEVIQKHWLQKSTGLRMFLKSTITDDDEILSDIHFLLDIYKLLLGGSDA